MKTGGPPWELRPGPGVAGSACRPSFSVSTGHRLWGCGWGFVCCFGFHEAIDSTLFFSKSSVLHKSVGNPHPGPIELLSAFYLLFEFLFSPCVWKTEDLAQAGADARRRRQSQQPVALMLFLLVSFAERTELVVNVPRVRILLQLTTAVSA